jgi:hypothetical protein
MACANFPTTMPIGLTGAFQMHSALFLVRKLIRRRTPFGSAAFSTHITAMAMHFPVNAGLMFLTDELTNDRYLVDTGATLCIVPCNQNSSPSSPLLKGADGQLIPSWGFVKKTVQFQGKLFTYTFLQAAVASPLLGIDFLRKFKVIVSHCKSPKWSSKGLNPLALFADQNHHWLLLCTWYTKKMDCGGLVAITAV